MPRILVPLWLCLAVLANAAMRDSFVYPRWVVATPAVALALAVGLDTITGRLVRGGASRTTVAAAVAAIAVVGQIVYYFDIHVPRLAAQALHAKPYRDGFDAVLVAASELPPGTDLFLITDPVVDPNPPRSLLRFLAGESGAMRLEVLAADGFDATSLDASPDRRQAFFVAPDDGRTVAALRRCYRLEGPRPSPYASTNDRVLDLYVAVPGARPAACGGP